MKPLLSVSQPGRSSPAQRLSSAADKFVMPSEPPTREQWVADSAVSVCMVCKVERFSMVSNIVNYTGLSRSGKTFLKIKKIQVREKSGNFIFHQGNLEEMKKKSWKSQGISKFSKKVVS